MSEFPFTLLSCAPGIADSRTPVIERSGYQYFNAEFIRSGAGYLQYDDGPVRRFERNGVYLLHRGIRHRYYPDRSDPWNKIFFVVSGPLVDLLVEGHRLEHVAGMDDAPQLWLFFDAMNRLGAGPDKEMRAAVIFHEFIEAFSRALRESGPSGDGGIVTALKRELDGHVRSRFTLAKFAAEHNYSVNHLIREFRLRFGDSPIAYLNGLRIEEARRMLRYSDLSVKEIANVLDFSSPFHFSNAFLEHTGVRPRTFRGGSKKTPR